jgi:hypothetical protein
MCPGETQGQSGVSAGAHRSADHRSPGQRSRSGPETLDAACHGSGRRPDHRNPPPASHGDPLEARLLAWTGQLRQPAAIALIETVGVRGSGPPRLALGPPQTAMALMTAVVMAATDLVKHGHPLRKDRLASLYLKDPRQGRQGSHRSAPVPRAISQKLTIVEWTTVVRWVLLGLILAEKHGVPQPMWRPSRRTPRAPSRALPMNKRGS